MKFLHKGVTLEGALEGQSSLRVWWKHVRKLWLVYIGGTLSVIFTNITDVVIPQFVARAIDALGRHDASYTRYVWPLFASLFLAFIGRIYWRQLLGQQTHYVAARLRSLLWNRARYFPRHRLQTDLSPGELMSVATSDVGIARFMFGFTLVGTVDFVFLLGLSLTAMFLIDTQLTLATLAVLPGVPWVVDRLSRRENAQHKIAQESLSQLTDLAAQAVATQRLQRVSQTHTFWERKLRSVSDDYRKKRLEVQKTSLAFIPITGAAPLISFSILLYLGVQKVLSGQLSIGEFVALQSYIFLVQQPMLELGVIISEWQRAKASLDRIITTLDQSEAPGLRSGGQGLALAPMVFQVRHLYFKHEGAEKALFTELEFELAQGKRLGIKGPIGSGKTVLIEILSGLERHFQGEVLLFGKDIRSYSHTALRSLMAVVPQKPFLFGDTVRSNMSLNNALSDTDIWHWLEVAGVKEDIAALPDGLDTRLGEWGVNLSGGQKQRLTLARALARKPAVLFLDDCLSAVDTVTEERILSNLDRELKDSTLVWVAHRASTLKYCTDRLELGASS